MSKAKAVTASTGAAAVPAKPEAASSSPKTTAANVVASSGSAQPASSAASTAASPSVQSVSTAAAASKAVVAPAKPVVLSLDDKLQQRLARFGGDAPTEADSSVDSKLKRRAERFKAIDVDDEKKKKRVELFGPPAEVLAEEKLKQRAERFQTESPPAAPSTVSRLRKRSLELSAAAQAKLDRPLSGKPLNRFKKQTNGGDTDDMEARQQQRLNRFGIQKKTIRSFDPTSAFARRVQRYQLTPNARPRFVNRQPVFYKPFKYNYTYQFNNNNNNNNNTQRFNFAKKKVFSFNYNTGFKQFGNFQQQQQQPRFFNRFRSKQY